MNKGYKFRIYPNEKQIELIEKTFGCTRFVYNHFLNQIIILEDLSIKNMMKNTNLSRDIADVSWHNRTIHKIDKWYPSSKTCSYCDYTTESMPLPIV